jgi:hypothetical protein
MQKSQSLPDDWIPDAGKPTDLIGRQQIDVTAQRLHEQHL